MRTHEHYGRAVEILKRVYDREISAYMLAHGMAEIYSVLTRGPFKPKIDPEQGWKIVSSTVLEFFQVVHLSTEDYRQTLRASSEDGLSGGRIFDALHIRAARNAQCERIYTFNVRHFRQLAPDLADMIVAP